MSYEKLSILEVRNILYIEYMEIFDKKDKFMIGRKSGIYSALKLIDKTLEKKDRRFENET